MIVESLSSKDLIDLCIENASPDAWPEFVRRFNPVISSSIAKRLRGGGTASRDDIDELVQQVYLHLCESAFQGLRRLRAVPEESIAAYLRVIAVNLATDYMRKKASITAGGTTRMVELDGFEVAVGAEADRTAFYADVDRLLERCITVNPARDRRVFWLYYRAGLTARDIARIPYVDLEVKGVESLLHRLSDCVRKNITEGISGSASLIEKGKGPGER